jgi:hypothetical protein
MKRPSPGGSWSFCAACLWLVALPALAQPTSSSQPHKLLDPRSFGFDIPPGRVSFDEQTVETTDTQGEIVVARTQVRIGEHRIVLLPDGQLVARKPQETRPSERPFERISKEQLLERLKAEFPKFTVKQGKSYVFVYTSSEEFALGTTKILESMYPGVKKWAEQQKLSVHDPATPLVAIMFRTEADFQRYRRMPEGVVAYYDTLSNRIVMFEQSDRFGDRRDLAIQQAISTIAHEGTHQILHNIGVQRRLSLWPMWFSEGLAEFLAPTEVNKRLQWKGAAQVNDLRMFELEQYVKSRSTEEPNGDTVKKTVLAARLTSTGYASAWSLTHFLATKKKAEFNKYLLEVSKIGPLQGSIEVVSPGLVPGNARAFEACFGDDYVGLEKKLIAHLQKLPYEDPFAGMPHYLAMITYGEGKKGKREANTFHSPLLADKWVQDMREKITGDVVADIRRFPNRPAAETFGRAWLKAN